MEETEGEVSGQESGYDSGDEAGFKATTKTKTNVKVCSPDSPSKLARSIIVKDSRIKQRPRCYLCRKRLETVFQVCRCCKMFCAACVDPKAHKCMELNYDREDKNKVKEVT